MPFPLFFILAAALGAKDEVERRKEKKTLLDLEAERLNTIGNIDLGISSISAFNDFDGRQIEAMQKQFQSAQGMLQSKNPKLQAIGANIMQDLDTAVRQQIQQNETEARADVVRAQDREIANTGLGRADNEKRFERSLAMNKQLNAELKPLEISTLSFNKVMNLLNTNDQISSLSALTAFVQSIDNSVVRESELLKYQGANGLITQFVNIVNKSEGRDFDSSTKQSLRNASAALMNAAKTQATTIVNSFQLRATAFGLDVKKVLSGIDETLFTQIPIDRTTQDALQAEADAAEAAFRAAPEDFKVVKPSGIARAGALGIGVAQEIMRATGMLLRGSELLQDDDGNLFELTIAGDVIPITEAEILKATRARQQEIINDTSMKGPGIELTPSAQKRRAGLRPTIRDTKPIERRP